MRETGEDTDAEGEPICWILFCLLTMRQALDDRRDPTICDPLDLPVYFSVTGFQPYRMQQLFLYGVPFGVIDDSYSRIEDSINWSMVRGAQIRAVVVFQAQLGSARPIGLRPGGRTEGPLNSTRSGHQVRICCQMGALTSPGGDSSLLAGIVGVCAIVVFVRWSTVGLSPNRQRLCALIAGLTGK